MPFAKIRVFLDTGLQKQFIPLRLPKDVSNIPKTSPSSLLNAIISINDFQSKLSSDEKQELDNSLNAIFEGNKKPEVQSNNIFPYIKTRFGTKTWNLKNGSHYTLEGIWFLIETNTSAQDENKNLPKIEYDRGYHYETTGLTDVEKNDIIEAYKNHQAYSKGKYCPYINMSPGQEIDYETQFEVVKEESNNENETESSNDENTRKREIKLTIGDNKFQLIVIDPAGKKRDIDVILDLGNTRTSGLLFDHQQNKAFNPDDFRQLFKVLRIKPDPQSGEYNTLDDVEAGIAESWIVLHQLEHQTYHQPVKNQDTYPELIQTEIKDPKVEVIKKGLFRNSITYNVIGKAIKRIPQMFTQLSPVLLGDQAERQFNLPYAKAMIAVGARIQQSSPKRYYWDDTQTSVWWSMLLNEWDKAYNDQPLDKAALPKLQGEMLRFINEDGKIMDFTQDKEPTECPMTCPTEPKYPRQSTLTWFLLHILELAYSQSNSSFLHGANFIPHRLRKILITYPSGWTNDEVDAYRERCQEALDIFSQTNIYKGINSDLRLEMVPKEKTPDEAVAGQLPIVFSEIIKYKNQTVDKWIKIFGKKRKKSETVRIMNFDIGGGTTDISVVEYIDNNPPNAIVRQNILKTTLLFKDGKSIAGDELVKRVIEKYILGELIKKLKKISEKQSEKKTDEISDKISDNTSDNISDNIFNKFTTVFTDPQDSAIRSRIIRTCLIPLAIKILTLAGSENNTSFSPETAGINENNWNEFLDFIEIDKEAIPFTQPCFNFNNSDLNQLMEELYARLFHNCANYAAAYDVDMLIFSGKTSELPYIKEMAQKYIPIDNGRMIFAKGYKAGQWYPFTDKKGYISDAKTVTVVGAALYYALAEGLIAGWKITSSRNIAERNEWGEYNTMASPAREIFMDKKTDSKTINILPNTIIARRLNKASSPEPVYKFISHDNAWGNQSVSITIERKNTIDGEYLVLSKINNQSTDLNKFELKLWPCIESNGNDFWQEKGVFSNL